MQALSCSLSGLLRPLLDSWSTANALPLTQEIKMTPSTIKASKGHRAAGSAHP